MDENSEITELRYSEGQSYAFRISKIIRIPDSGEKHLVLIGPDQKKFLLKACYFDHYELKIGDTINCSVDKINCSGQIFLEPEHPHYRIGQHYDFLLMRIKKETNIWCSQSYTAWVRDVHHLEWPCYIDQPDSYMPRLSHLSCRVERIRKAQIYLSLPGTKGAQMKLLRNTIYNFKLSEIREFKSEVYYILKDPYGKYHQLLKKYYEHFNYSLGQLIQAKVVELNADGTYIIEPLNPYYSIEEVYSFKFLKFEKNATDAYNSHIGSIWVIDHYGQAIKTKPNNWQIEATNYQPEHIVCKVVKFKKGKLVLENLTEPGIF